MQEEKEKEAHYLGHRKRLKERFLVDEGKSMPDYELLELLLCMAIPRKDVKEKAKDLLKTFGSFNKVITASQQTLRDYGLTENVIAAFKLVSSCAIKMSWQELNESNETVLSNYDYMIDYCKTAMSHLDHEEFRVIMLNSKLQITKEQTIQKGSVKSVQVHPREVLKAVLNSDATSVILLHNHPGGKAEPSRSDLLLTQQMVEVLNAAGVYVADHIIIAGGTYYSFHDHHLINNNNVNNY